LQSNESAVGTVAVIDLDAVARQIGGDIQMANSIKQRETSLNQQLQSVQTSFQKQIGDKRDELGGEPTEEETQQFALLQRQANTNLNQIRTQAQNDLNRHRLQLVARFREEARPVARAVAAEKGLSIVVTKNDSVVFTYQSAVDITDEVAARMLARRPATAIQPTEEVAQPPSADQTRRSSSVHDDLTGSRTRKSSGQKSCDFCYTHRPDALRLLLHPSVQD
jgi:Skp family chaperone for outer membrane proteins